MKILSLSTCALDPLLGSGKTRLRWTEGLRDLGHTVDVAEPRDYETWHGMRRAVRFRQAWGACRFVKQKLEAGAYDAIEFFGAEFGLITRQLAKLRERPLIVAHTDGLELLASERERAYNPPRSLMAHAHSWYWRQTHERLSRAAFVYADAFVTGCEWIVSTSSSTGSSSRNEPRSSNQVWMMSTSRCLSSRKKNIALRIPVRGSLAKESRT